MCACQHSKESSSSIKEISWLPTISFQGGCCSATQFWHQLGMLVQAFVCVTNVWCSKSTMFFLWWLCTAHKNTWNQWMPRSHQSMAMAYKIYITTITFLYSTPSHLSVTDCRVRFAVWNELKEKLSWWHNMDRFYYTETFAEPFSVNTRLNCLIKHVQNAEIWTMNKD